jgi:hypothetical protein
MLKYCLSDQSFNSRILDFQSFSYCWRHRQRIQQQLLYRMRKLHFYIFIVRTIFLFKIYGVPYLKLYIFVLKLYSFRFKVNSDCNIIIFQKLPMNIFMNERWFANTFILSDYLLDYPMTMTLKLIPLRSRILIYFFRENNYWRSNYRTFFYWILHWD